MKELTDKQKQVLEYITWCLKTNGVQPSWSEIQEKFGYRTKRSVALTLNVLEEQGYIKRTPRTFKVTNKSI